MAAAIVRPEILTTRYERLVERWIDDVASWSTAKKTVVAMAIAAVFHSVVGACVFGVMSTIPELVHLRRVAVVFVAWVLVVLGLMLTALVPLRRGTDGRWTVYLVVVVYGTFVAVTVTLFGLGSTPWFAIAPLVVLFVPMYYDLRAGRFALGYLMVALPTASALELAGLIPHAPLMLERSFEAQRVLGWHLATYLYVLAVLGYVFVMVHFSVSVRDAQQRRLERTQRDLEAASRHKSEFLASMSHELRTPLNAVIGFSEVLQSAMFGPLNAKQAEYVDDILDSGRHLLSLINDILDLAKIEAGRDELSPSRFDLRAAIANALTLTRERAGRQGLRLECRIEDAIDAIEADERKVKQVLLNLLTNAVKFTPSGGTVTVSALRSHEGVTVAVADTGIGIAPEHQETIFTEFWQVAGHHTRTQEGTGLGLALARRFVELHGGRLWVESAVGRGSVFRFTLPGAPAAMLASGRMAS